MKKRSSVSLLIKMIAVILLSFLLLVNNEHSIISLRPTHAHPLFVWITEKVGVTGSCFDMHVSLALNADGTPHISYYDSDASALMHASRTTSGWSSSVVDNSEMVGSHSSIALDSVGYPHIAYRDMTKNALKYASWDGIDWDLTFVGEYDYGWYPSLVIDSDDLPHISYLGYNAGTGSQTPKYSHWTGDHWDISVIDPVFAFGGTSLALDSYERPHVSYHTSQKLWYAVYSDTVWTTENVDSIDMGSVSGVGLYNSIALDILDQAHISYALYGLNFSPPYPDDLKYAVRQGGIWTFDMPETQGQVGFYSSIDLDSLGHPHISYYDSSNQALKYISKGEAYWNGIVVDSPVVLDGYTSLTLDGDNHPHIAYCDGLSSAIKYARRIRLENHFFLPLLFSSFEDSKLLLYRK